MKCSCLGSGPNGYSYESLASSSDGSTTRLPMEPFTNRRQLSNSPSSSLSDGLSTPPKQVELKFINDDNSFQVVLIEENLRASDLCQLLALRNHVTKDVSWTIVEYLDKLGLQRSLEDHESVLDVYRQWSESKPHNNKFYFRQDFRKYEFLQSPQQFFPSEMSDLKREYDCLSDSPETARIITLKSMLDTTEEIPQLFGHLAFTETTNRSTSSWRKGFFVLENGTLYSNLKSAERDPSQLTKMADARNYDIYTAINQTELRSPYEHCFAIKPKISMSDSNYYDSLPLWQDQQNGTSSNTDLICFGCDSERIKSCWIVALRLAKFGKLIRENYRLAKTRLANERNLSTTPTDEFGNPALLSESVKTRVAMDFTGNYGRIVEDPLEAQAIRISEGYHWNKKQRANNRCVGINGNNLLKGIEAGVHITQPWFHSGLSREDAVSLLNKHGTVDGVFLVRESQSQGKTYVLSFVRQGKICHSQIVPIEEKEHLCYSLDNGQTKFYNVLQLVEFYQLNPGCLQTRLTHYIAESRSLVRTRNDSSPVMNYLD